MIILWGVTVKYPRDRNYSVWKDTGRGDRVGGVSNGAN